MDDVRGLAKQTHEVMELWIQTGKTLLCLSKFCDLGQIMPWLAFLSGLLREVTEKILSNVSTRAVYTVL